MYKVLSIFFFADSVVYSIYQDRRQQQQQQQHHHHERHSFIDSSDNNSGLLLQQHQRQHDFESTIHTISTNNESNDHYKEYDDIEEDNESVDKTLFQRHQSDNVSLANSLFTAVDHLEISDDHASQEEDDEEDDDNSSTENTRHGYLPTQQYEQENHDSINSYMKQLNVQTSIVWEGNCQSSPPPPFFFYYPVSL
jgi:hypothetical protein